MSKENKSVARSTIIAKLRQIEALAQQCIVDFEAQPHRESKRTRPSLQGATPTKLDFDANERNFVRTHGVRLSGSKKFVLLTAYVAKGAPGKEVQLKNIEGMWNRMTGILGGEFNRKYSNDAKERGWVDTKKKGAYILRPTWREIL